MLLISGTPGLAGDINGRNTVFEAQKAISPDAIVSINGLSRAPGDATSNGYRLDGRQVRLQEPLVTGDILTVYLPPASNNEMPSYEALCFEPKPGHAFHLQPIGSASGHHSAALGTARIYAPAISRTVDPERVNPPDIQIS